jgi:hypothetical protein
MILVIYDDNESHAYRCFVAEQSTRIEQWIIYDVYPDNLSNLIQMSRPSVDARLRKSISKISWASRWLTQSMIRSRNRFCSHQTTLLSTL